NPIEETIINRSNQPIINHDLLIAIVCIESLYHGYRIRNSIHLNQAKYLIETLLSTINSQNNNSKTTTDNYDNSSSIQSKLYKDMNSYLNIKEYPGNYGDIPSPCPMYHTGPELHHMNRLHNSLH
ncbi:unnamed protein product, partial [Schistosoma margrebowiei]